MIITPENLEAQRICNLRYEAQRGIPVVFHNGSGYDFHIIIKELANEFRKDKKCLGENTEKNISFSVLMRITNDDGEVVSCKLKFIDSLRVKIRTICLSIIHGNWLIFVNF